MSKLTTPVQYLYTKGDKVFKKTSSTIDNTDNELWLPINFYWESRIEACDEMLID